MYLYLCDLNIVKITKPPTEVYRTFTTRIYTYIVTYKKIVVKPLYFSLICESVENTTLLKSYNFVTILLQFVFRSFFGSYTPIYTLSMYTD